MNGVLPNPEHTTATDARHASPLTPATPSAEEMDAIIATAQAMRARYFSHLLRRWADGVVRSAVRLGTELRALAPVGYRRKLAIP